MPCLSTGKYLHFCKCLQHGCFHKTGATIRTDRPYYCGLDAALSVVGGRWKYLVVRQLASKGPRRYGQLRRLVNGVTEKVLIGALKELEAGLTPFGVSLAEALRPLCEWGYVHMGRDHPYSQVDHPSKFPQERPVDLPRGSTRLTVSGSRAAKFSAIERRQANCRTRSSRTHRCYERYE